MTRQKISNYDLQFVAPITNNIEYIGVGISGTVWMNNKLFSDGDVDESPGVGITTGTTALGTKLQAARVDHTHNLSPSFLNSGIYLPTFNNTTNIAASSLQGAFFYQRTGNIVHVSGSVSIDPTATGAILLGISLPIASNFAGVHQCVGLGINTNGDHGYVNADFTNDIARLQSNVTSAANFVWYIDFTYRIL